MITVHEVSRLAGVSVRTLHHYDRIGLLKPAQVTSSGYRLYDEKALRRLSKILLYKELQFSLKEIAGILDAPDFETEVMLERQIFTLTLQKQRTEAFISLAREIQKTGGFLMPFDTMNEKKAEEYAAEAKALWGDTPAYHEYEEKSRSRDPGTQKALAGRLMALFAEFGAYRQLTPECEKVQQQVQKLRNFITENYYHCTDEILLGLGELYAAGGEFTENIDQAGGNGTAAFVRDAIRCAVVKLNHT